jgi:biotin-(acetyl-CoA carboxylase) ligase
MSLTSQDLQAISDLIDQRLEIKLEQKLEEKLEEKLEAKLEQKLEQKLNQKFNQKLKPIRKELREIRMILNDTISFFDHQVINHDRRLDRLENHVGLAKFVNPA